MTMNNLMDLIRLHGNADRVVSLRNTACYSWWNENGANVIVGRAVVINKRIKEDRKNKKIRLSISKYELLVRYLYRVGDTRIRKRE